MVNNVYLGAIINTEKDTEEPVEFLLFKKKGNRGDSSEEFLIKYIEKEKKDTKVKVAYGIKKSPLLIMATRYTIMTLMMAMLTIVYFITNPIFAIFGLGPFVLWLYIKKPWGAHAIKRIYRFIFILGGVFLALSLLFFVSSGLNDIYSSVVVMQGFAFTSILIFVIFSLYIFLRRQGLTFQLLEDDGYSVETGSIYIRGDRHLSQDDIERVHEKLKREVTAQEGKA